MLLETMAWAPEVLYDQNNPSVLHPNSMSGAKITNVPVLWPDSLLEPEGSPLEPAAGVAGVVVLAVVLVPFMGAVPLAPGVVAGTLPISTPLEAHPEQARVGVRKSGREVRTDQ